MVSVELCGDVYVIGAVVVTVVVVVVSGAGIPVLDVTVVVVVVFFVVSALELSLFLEILSPLSIQ